MADTVFSEGPHELVYLTEIVKERPESLALGNDDIRTAALTAAKYAFDTAIRMEETSIRHISELLESLNPAQAPQTRSQAKRKRSPSPARVTPTLKETPIASLHVDGMDEEQIWAQLELKNKALCETLRYALDATGEDLEGDDTPESLGLGEDEDGDLDMDNHEDSEEDSEEDEEDELDESESEEEVSDEDSEEDNLGEGITILRDPDEAPSSAGDTLFSHINAALNKPKKLRGRGGRSSELDDGFFNLADFNAQSEKAEAGKVSRGSLADDSDEDEDIEEIDLYKAMDDTEKDGDEAEPTYQDFFAPVSNLPIRTKPKAALVSPKKLGQVRFHDEVRVKNIKARGKSLPMSALSLFGGLKNMKGDTEDGESEDEEYAGPLNEDGDEDGDEEGDDDDEDLEDDEDENDMGDIGGMTNGDVDMASASDDDTQLEEDDEANGDAIIKRFQDDLFADEDEIDEQDTAMTTHEKRQAELRKQIEQLEAENVAKKDWTLMGEASARLRPQNSLLEEDLEFERVAKIVPVMTVDVIQQLEDRIKARILAGQFDDVVRQRATDDKAYLPSRFFELQDTKSKQSLSEIYADEYVAAQTGGVAGDDRDGKLRKEHEELTAIWDGICYKLDALCNAHFTPKQPKATISTISNVAAASLESALPTTRASATMLAPEEVFAPTSSDLRARSELTPVEKRSQRNQVRKAKRKERDALGSAAARASGKTLGSVKKQKEEAMKSVVKTGKGVTVIGKETKGPGRKARA